MRFRSLVLPLILIGHIGLSLAFNLLNPIFEGPDEPNHFLFVRYLQTHRQLPIQDTNRDGVRAHHPPGYFWLGALFTAWVPVEGETLPLQANPRYWLRLDDDGVENKSLFIHFGPEERWPYQGVTLMVHLVRMLSLAFSSLAVALTYHLARQLRPDHEALAGLAAGLLAFNPMVVYMSAMVQNDASALAAGAAVLYALSRFARQGFTLRRWFMIGVIFALGILLKAGVLSLAAPIGFMVLDTAYRQHSWRALLAGVIGVAFPVVGLTGWWFVRNQQLYGDWTANSSVVALWGPLTAQQRWEFLPSALYYFSTGLLGRFGNAGIVNFPLPFYLGAGLIAVTALGRLAWVALARWRAVRHQPPEARWSWFALERVLWVVHGLTVGLVALSVFTFALQFNGGAAGKYLFPAYPSLALLLAAGGLHWFSTRHRNWAMAALVSLNLGVSVYALVGLILPTYGPPRSPLAWELNRMTRLDADIGATARVLGYSLSADHLAPGQELAVTVVWSPESLTDVPYTVFVHLYSPTLGSLAQQDIFPGAGTYATTVWTPGRPFVDTYRLRAPDNLSLVSDARILLGLYDEVTQQRLPVTGPDAGPPEAAWVQFGAITIQP